MMPRFASQFPAEPRRDPQPRRPGLALVWPLLLGLSAAPGTRAADTVPPILQSVRIAVVGTGQIDTARGNGFLKIAIEAKDGDSGVDYVELRFAREDTAGNLDPARGFGLRDTLPENQLTSSNNGGTYQLVVKVPKGLAAGTYRLHALRLFDEAGNKRGYFSDPGGTGEVPLPIGAAAARVEIRFGTNSGGSAGNPAGDTSPPEAKGMQLSPSRVDVAGTNAFVDVFVQSADTGSGLRWLDVWYGAPDGSRISEGGSASAPGAIVEGSLGNGMYYVRLRIPKDSPAGDWQLGGLLQADAAGNLSLRSGAGFPLLAVLNGTSPNTGAPAAPTGGSATAGSVADKIQMAWTATANAQSYAVYRGTTSRAADASKLGMTPTTAYEDTTAVPGVLYYYWVEAVNAVGPSPLAVLGAGYALSSSGGATPATPDFDGDTLADLILQHNRNGKAVLWYLRGPEVVGSEALDSQIGPSAPWRIVGTWDFDRNGSPDLVWQNPENSRISVWMMDGPDRLWAGGPSRQMRDDKWLLAAIADFDQDGEGDFLWQSKKSGALAVWYLNRLQFLSARVLSSRPQNSVWRAAGAADMDQDGDPDILFQNESTGSVNLWKLQGLQLVSAQFLGGRTRLRVAGLSDVNTDGMTDLIWQDPATGRPVIWFMDGASPLGVTGLSLAPPGSAWQIRNSRPLH